MSPISERRLLTEHPVLHTHLVAQHMTHEPSDRPKLQTAREVAATLNCDTNTVYRMFGAGRLTGLYLMGPPQNQRRGKKGIRIFKDSVDALLVAGPQEVTKFQQNLAPKDRGATASPPCRRTTRQSKPKATGRAWETLPPPS